MEGVKMAEFKNSTYKFKFTDPILFRRVYNFKIDNSLTNEYWSPSDSDEKEVAKYLTKDTPVYNMTLIYHQRESKINSYYYIILRSDNNCDTFKVSAYDISNLLEMFNIM